MQKDTFRKYAEEFPALEGALIAALEVPALSRRTIASMSLEVKYLDAGEPDLTSFQGSCSDGDFIKHDETEVAVYAVNETGGLDELRIAGQEVNHDWCQRRQEGQPLREALLGHAGFKYVVAIKLDRTWWEHDVNKFSDVDWTGKYPESRLDLDRLNASEPPEPMRNCSVTIYRRPREGKWDRLYGPETRTVWRDPKVSGPLNPLPIPASLADLVR